MRSLIRPAFFSLLVFTLITGLIYPTVVTGIAGLIFPVQAGGSLIVSGDSVRGSTLIGQPFNGPQYFWPRPSATGPVAYNGASSSGSNLGPTNPAQIQAVKDRIAALRAADSGNTAPVPVDLVTASGSGLDPQISPAAAAYQIARVARVRGLPVERVQALVDRHTEERQFGLLGERRVTVLPLNLALDSLSGAP